LSVIVVYSSLAMLMGLYLAWLVHSRGKLEIVLEAEPAGPRCNGASSMPLISVIIPARNEARNIGECLRGILAQSYPNFEVIVVDDRSTDDTPRILADLVQENQRLGVISGAELPPGWVGKPYALMQGAAAAQGEWLCFMDADTFSTPELLWTTYHFASLVQQDMLTILTRQVLGSFWERTILPLVFLGLSFGFPAERVNDPTRRDAIANGQFILIRRAVYQEIGGHAAVKGRIDEDRALAALVKRSGYRLVLADGRKLAHTRMYTSLPEMWEGWTKNIYLGLQGRYGLLLFGGLLGFLATLVLPLWLAGGITWLASGGGPGAGIMAGEAIVVWGYLLWQRLQGCLYFNIPEWYAFTFPLGSLVFSLMMLASTYDVLSGHGVSWKGRRYLLSKLDE
jgi:chlorobactene glucosyltransferase